MAGRFPWVWGQSGLHRAFKESHGYTVRLCPLTLFSQSKWVLRYLMPKAIPVTWYSTAFPFIVFLFVYMHESRNTWLFLSSFTLSFNVPKRLCIEAVVAWKRFSCENVILFSLFQGLWDHATKAEDSQWEEVHADKRKMMTGFLANLGAIASGMHHKL